MDEVCKSLARWVFLQVPMDLCLDTFFPLIHVSFEEDSVNTLRKVGLGSPGCAGLFGKNQGEEVGSIFGSGQIFCEIQEVFW